MSDISKIFDHFIGFSFCWSSNLETYSIVVSNSGTLEINSERVNFFTLHSRQINLSKFFRSYEFLILI